MNSISISNKAYPFSQSQDFLHAQPANTFYFSFILSWSLSFPNIIDVYLGSGQFLNSLSAFRMNNATSRRFQLNSVVFVSASNPNTCTVYTEKHAIDADDDGHRAVLLATGEFCIVPKMFNSAHLICWFGQLVYVIQSILFVIELCNLCEPILASRHISIFIS